MALTVAFWQKKVFINVISLFLLEEIDKFKIQKYSNKHYNMSLHDTMHGRCGGRGTA